MKEALKQIIDLLQPVAALADETPFENSEVIQRCVDASEIALDTLAQPTSGDFALGYAEGFNDACKPAQQEPVAWMREDGTLRFAEGKVFAVNQPFYTTPPQRTWVGLTDEEVKTLRYKIDVTAHWTYDKFHEAIEAKLKEKNNGLL